MLKYYINNTSYSTHYKLFQQDVIKWIRKNIINLYQTLISFLTTSKTSKIIF